MLFGFRVWFCSEQSAFRWVRSRGCEEERRREIRRRWRMVGEGQRDSWCWAETKTLDNGAVPGSRFPDSGSLILSLSSQEGSFSIFLKGSWLFKTQAIWLCLTINNLITFLSAHLIKMVLGLCSWDTWEKEEKGWFWEVCGSTPVLWGRGRHFLCSPSPAGLHRKGSHFIGRHWF